MRRPVCGVARSAPADAACLGSGSATRTLVHACIGRLSVVAGTARARCLRQLAAVYRAEMLPAINAEADRALGPMLPSSARERWPFCVLRDLETLESIPRASRSQARCSRLCDARAWHAVTLE